VTTPTPPRYDRPVPGDQPPREQDREPRSLKYHENAGARTMPVGQVMLVGAIALFVGALLNADSLYATASRQDFGWQRTAARGVVTPFRSLSHALGLNEPRKAIEKAIGHETNADTTVRHGISRKPKVKITEAAPPAIVLRHGSPAKPLRVWIGGDSMTHDYGLAFQSKLGGTPGFTVDLDYRISTGLTRPDYFDWPAELADNVLPKKPEVMVVMFGANDAQAMELPNGVFDVGSPEWNAEYRRRVGDTMDLLAGDGRMVIWVGQPYMRDNGFSDRMAVLNQIFEEEAAKRPWVKYLDSRPVLSAPGKPGYAEYLPDSSGAPTLARQGDGIHLSEFGSQKLADATIDLIDQSIDEYAPKSSSSDSTSSSTTSTSTTTPH
jgi:hypothetical protein